MTKRNYDTYDAFFTFELLEDALSNRGKSGEKIVTTLEAIKEDMRIAPKLPSAVAAKPVTSIELVQQTSATKLIKQLDKSFTYQSIGIYLGTIVRINDDPGIDEKVTGNYDILCEYQTGEKTRSRRNLDARMLRNIHGAISRAKAAVADFDEDPSGWILREDIHILRQHLKYDKGQEENDRVELKEAWARARTAQEALSGLEKMFGDLFADEWKLLDTQLVSCV